MFAHPNDDPWPPITNPWQARMAAKELKGRIEALRKLRLPEPDPELNDRLLKLAGEVLEQTKGATPNMRIG